MEKVSGCLLILWISWGASQAQTTNDFQTSTDRVLWLLDWKFQAGDSLQWKQPTYSYVHWPRLRLRQRYILNEHQGIFWLKTKVNVSSDAASPCVLHHYVMNSATEIFWDGISIYQNGRIGTHKNNEQYGSFTVLANIPAHLLTSGIHEISIRVSNFHHPERALFGRANLGVNTAMQSKNSRWVLEHTIVTTTLSLLIVFCIWLFFGLGKNTSLLFFIGFCAIQLLELLLNFYGVYQSISIKLYNTLLGMLEITNTWDGFFLVGYLLYEFQLPHKKQWLLVAAILSIVTGYWLFLHWPAIVLLGSIVAIKAIRQKQKTALLILLGIIGWAFFAYLRHSLHLPWGYFIGLIILLMSMIMVSLIQIHQRLKQKHRIELRTARLENQLLKKNIQPHFLMNSLISLQQLIHENPMKAEEMIDELAAEFQVFSRVAEKKLISLREELTLCRAHLRIMEFRKDAVFTLETIGISGEELIPPAVFHTLIENGLTHGYGSKPQGKFILEKMMDGKQVVYRLWNDGEVEKGEKLMPEVVKRKGTGLRYIEARLGESYGHRWQMSYGPVAGGWEVQMHLPAD